MLEKFRRGLSNDLYLRVTASAPERVSRAIVAALPRGPADLYVTVLDRLVARGAMAYPRITDFFVRLVGMG